MAATKLKDDELTDELSEEGLIKPTLDSVPVPVGDSYNRLQKRDADVDFNERSLEMRAGLRKLRIEELREQTSHITWVSSSGTKKERLENNEDIVEDIEDGEDTKKGSGVLDQYISDQVKSHYHVLQQGDEIYDVTLNKTNIKGNNNKFYIIQALEANDGSTFMVYNRWGKLGMEGHQDRLHGPYTDIKFALYEFEKKFHDKTNNNWSERKKFVYQPKFYTWLEVKYEAGRHIVVQGNLRRKPEIQIRETKLEKRIAAFISLICNDSMMEKQMKEIGYNTKKRPLRKLSKVMITKGYEVLQRVACVIDQTNTKKLQHLSGEFYTIIPHDFGFKDMSEFVIDTSQKLKIKLEMVEDLAKIEFAIKLLEVNVGAEEDPLISRYKRLRCELTPVEVDSKEFLMIHKYMKNTHAETHSDYTAEIVQIFGVSRHGEAERFSKFSNTENRMLLWHGSRLTNWVDILSQGLMITHPAAPVKANMFGKGVYFSDMFSKSANYCRASEKTSDGVLLLCEVALGDMVELLKANYDADKLPQGKLSTKGVGATGPDMSESETLEDGVVVPLGHPKKQLTSKVKLLYNEYVVYNVDQIRMRYIVHVKFNFKKQHVPLEKPVSEAITMVP